MEEFHGEELTRKKRRHRAGRSGSGGMRRAEKAQRLQSEAWDRLAALDKYTSGRLSHLNPPTTEAGALLNWVRGHHLLSSLFLQKELAPHRQMTVTGKTPVVPIRTRGCFLRIFVWWNVWRAPRTGLRQSCTWMGRRGRVQFRHAAAHQPSGFRRQSKNWCIKH